MAIHTNNNKLVGLLILTSIIVACQQTPQFKPDSTGIEYQFIESNKDALKAQYSDVLTLDLRYKAPNDSVLFKGKINIKLDSVSYQGGAIEDALIMMHKGDSARFKVNLTNFYYHNLKQKPDFEFAEDDKLTFEIRLLDIMTKQEADKKREQMLMKRKEAEQIELQTFLDKNKVSTTPLSSGLYYIELQKGKGKKPKPGNSVSIHYKASLLNGDIFDSTYERNKPLQFTLGKGEVIAAFDEGVSHMNEGGRANLIVPSSLAYGKAGKGPYIRPYTPLVFEIELITIE